MLRILIVALALLAGSALVGSSIAQPQQQNDYAKKLLNDGYEIKAIDPHGNMWLQKKSNVVVCRVSGDANFYMCKIIN